MCWQFPGKLAVVGVTLQKGIGKVGIDQRARNQPSVIESPNHLEKTNNALRLSGGSRPYTKYAKARYSYCTTPEYQV